MFISRSSRIIFITMFTNNNQGRSQSDPFRGREKFIPLERITFTSTMKIPKVKWSLMISCPINPDDVIYQRNYINDHQLEELSPR